MNDNDIVKALVRCIARDCEETGCLLYNEADTYLECVTKLIEYALDIIERQKAEIDNLKWEIGKYKQDAERKWEREVLMEETP